MYSRVVVPVDCSELAWTAIGPAQQLAQRWDGELEVISVVRQRTKIGPATADIERYLAAFGAQDDTVVAVFDKDERQVADLLALHVKAYPGSFVVMTSHGRGRSAALLGSVAEGLLRLVSDPVMVFGPSIDKDHVGFNGPMLVCVDGTETSEIALDVAIPWALELEMDPWVVSVAKDVPAVIAGERIVESAYPHRMADRMAAGLGRRVDYEILHGPNPAKAVADFADSYQAGLIVAATHGRTGLDRWAQNSVTMNIVHHAPCPVLIIGSQTN